MSMRPRRRYTMRELSERPDRFRDLETAAFERAYARYMDEQERGDQLRDEQETREEVDE